MSTEIKDTLDAISRNLLADSLNYCASFKLVKCENMAGRSLPEILAVALGDGVVIGGASTVQATDVLESLKDALAYKGDDGSHPGQDYLASERFKKDGSLALTQMAELLEGANHIISFRLTKGHPFYPVFWDSLFRSKKKRMHLYSSVQAQIEKQPLRTGSIEPRDSVLVLCQDSYEQMLEDLKSELND